VSLAKTQKKLDDLKVKLRDSKALQSLGAHHGWQVVAEFLAATIEQKRARLESETTNWQQTQVIRAELSLLRQLLRTPEVTDAQIDGWAQEIAFQEEKAKMWRSLDIPQGARP
jgi:hypothetical protein